MYRLYLLLFMQNGVEITEEKDYTSTVDFAITIHLGSRAHQDKLSNRVF